MIEITWDEKRCSSPQECLRCLDECPPAVFQIHPRDGRKPGVPTVDWVITPVLLSLCTGCNVCEEVCPQDAIKVSVAQ